jgi:predicted DNA-binding transcriptional regulator YafY
MKKSTRLPFRRLICIDERIREKLYPNCKLLAKELECNEKTIARDIHAMRVDMDAPIAFDQKKNGYYYTNPDFYLPMVHLQERDVFAFVVADKILKQYESTPYYKQLKGALDKIAAYLPDSISMKDATEMFSFGLQPVSKFDQEKITRLQSAMREKKTMRIRYHSFSSQSVRERDIDPLKIHNYGGDNYLFAYCHEKKSVRTFAVSRILSLMATEKSFAPPKDFSLKAYLAGSFELTLDKKEHHVKIHFSPYQAQWIREKKWHETQIITEEPDGGILLSMTVQGLADVKRWVLKYGAEAEVLAPKALRDEVIQEIEKLSAAYQLKRYNLKT